MDWFLYDSGLRHETAKLKSILFGIFLLGKKEAVQSTLFQETNFNQITTI